MDYKKRKESFRSALARFLEHDDGKLSHALTRGLENMPTEIRAKFEDLIGAACDMGRECPLAPDAETLSEIRRLSDCPVFLGGVPKSGTTLLRNLVDNHPSLLVFPTDGGLALKYMLSKPDATGAQYRAKAMYSLLRRFIGVSSTNPEMFGWLTREVGDAPSPMEVLSRTAFALTQEFGDDVRGTCRSLVGALYCIEDPATRRGKKYWVSKGTGNVLRAQHLRQVFPNARFVEITRHPCAVFASQRRKQPMKGRPFRPYAELQSSLLWQCASYENRRLLGAQVYRVVAYEDLVLDPESAMKSVAEFLEIPYDDVLTRPTVHGFPASSNTAYPELHRHGEVSQGTRDKWRTELSADEVAVLTGYFDPSSIMAMRKRSAAQVVEMFRQLRALAKEYRRQKAPRGLNLFQIWTLLRLHGRTVRSARRLTE